MKASIKIRIGFVFLGLCIIFTGVPVKVYADENIAEIYYRNLPSGEATLKEEAVLVSKAKAVLSLESLGEVKIWKIFPVRISVMPEDGSINVVSVVIKYDKNKVVPVSIDSISSDFSIFLEEKIDQKKGEIIISYIKPLGLKEKAVVGDVNFKVISSGESEFSFSDDSSVLANDGFGTEVLREIKNLSVYIK